ncbi:MAG: hybrid sensor histidine kinase/response regulator [Thermodesulfobacteriota bacterium]
MRAPGDWERGLLRLEERRGSGFLSALCELAGAEHAALWIPWPPAARRLLLATELPAGTRARWEEAPGPAEEALWEGLRGRVALLPPPALQDLPLAGALPEVAWALAASDEGGGFFALLLGRGARPQALADDPLLAAALLRRLADRAAESRGLAPASEALARLSHELRTPLVSIKGYAELLLDRADEPLSQRARDWMRRIAAAANRLAGLFDKVTAEARADTPWTYLPRPVDPRELAARCVAEAEVLAGDRELRWAAVVPEGLAPVALDREAGRDVLLELLQNAARSTPDGGEVRAEARAEQRHGQTGVRFTVADTGVGIPAGAAADRLFERFGSLGSAMGHHSGDFEFGSAGLGLGLAMVRGVVRAHGGEVWAEGRGRDPGALPGAAFHLWLPVYRGASEAPERPPDVVGARVLVIDADPEASRILAEGLGGDFAVTCARTAAEALELWSRGGWLGCLVEPRLPAGGGTDLLRELRARAPGPAAILTYSTGGASETAAWRAAGADGCLAKPARARLLVQRLRSVHARRSR